MPIAKKYQLEDLRKKMFEIDSRLPSRRRLQVEYVIIKDFNDSIEDAKRFSGLVPKKSLINLIRVNDTGTGLLPPIQENIATFKAELRKQGYICYVREPRGRDISAACGMLAGTRRLIP
jgi:23S rRNA (adenine2503-C2)-methyltransferase